MRSTYIPIATVKTSIVVPRSGCASNGREVKTTSVSTRVKVFSGSRSPSRVSSFAICSASASASSSPGCSDTPSPGSRIQRLAPPAASPIPGISGSHVISHIMMYSGAEKRFHIRTGTE